MKKLKYFRVCERCNEVVEVKTEDEAVIDLCEKCSSIKCCAFCKEDYIPKHKYGLSLYCSTTCRGRANAIRNGTAAKPFKCLHCGTFFKRRSAKNTLCLVCRDKFALGKKMSKGEAEYPKLDRDVEICMIDIWLKNNKVKKGGCNEY